MHSLVVGLAICLCIVAAQAQNERRGYTDPCRGKSCGNHGCCVRRDPEYYGGSIFYSRAICACDEHYYYHRQRDDCRHGCYQNTCNQYASCYAKGRGDRYPGFDRWDIYLNEYYYCKCNDGYRGNGRRCVKIDPCASANCHQYATCIAKDSGSTSYPGYNTYNGYAQNAYYCQCNKNYYGNGRQCTHGCDSHTCHSQYATCTPKNVGLSYPGSSQNRIYRSNYYYCQCNTGYQGNGRRCDPIDPCSKANCHQYATCHSKSYGSINYYNYASFKGYVNSNYYCRCRENYYGNGRQCTHKCAGHNCNQYARCIPKSLGLDYPGSRNYNIYRNNYYYCECNTGYVGNGRRCAPRDPCHNNADCDRYATCHSKRSGSRSYHNYNVYKGYVENDYYCRCNDNYYGNGRECTPHCGPNSCHHSAVCVPKPYGSTKYPTYEYYPTFRNQYYYCSCPSGTFWDGSRCARCRCHRHASCILKQCGSPVYPGWGNYRDYTSLCYYCRCNNQYSGNGQSCIRFSG